MKKVFGSLIVAGLLGCMVAKADPSTPAVSGGASGTATAQTKPVPLPEQIKALTTQLAQLTSEVKTNSKSIALLNKQQRAFYQTLNQRIQQLENLSNNGVNGNTSSVPNVLAKKHPSSTRAIAKKHVVKKITQ